MAEAGHVKGRPATTRHGDGQVSIAIEDGDVQGGMYREVGDG